MIADALAAARPRSARDGRAAVTAVERPLRSGTQLVTGAWAFTIDALWLLAIVASVPIVILVVGTPVALAIRLLLWLGGLLWALVFGGDVGAVGR